MSAEAAPALPLTPIAAYVALRTAYRSARSFLASHDRDAVDQDLYMPAAGLESRLVERQVLESEAQARFADPKIAHWLRTVADSPLQNDPDVAATLRVIGRAHRRATALPPALVQDLATVTGKAQQAFHDARKANRFEHFRPYLAEMVRLKREEGSRLGAMANGIATETPQERTPADALLDQEEPGASTVGVRELIRTLFRELGPLTQRVLDTAAGAPTVLRGLEVPIDVQAHLDRGLAGRLGLDPLWSRYVIGLDPMTTNFGQGDHRVYMMFRLHDLFYGVYATIHEVGHAHCNRGFDLAFPIAQPGLPSGDSPLADTPSIAISEGVANLFENGIGRRRAFWDWFRPQLMPSLPGSCRSITPEALYREANRPGRNMPRVRSDSLTLWLREAVRFEVEDLLVSDGLDPADVPKVWDDRMEQCLGVRPRTLAEGCLNIPHWAYGWFFRSGSYVLGPVYGAQFHAALTRDVPQLDDQIREGNFRSAIEWVHTNVSRHGRRCSPEQLIVAATGRPLDHHAFVAELHERYDHLYDDSA